MSLTASTMMELGTKIPSFALPDVSTGRMVRTPEQGPVLVMFICRHCPYVIHVKSELARIGKDYAGKVAIIAISSNDAGYVAEDSPDRLKAMVQEEGFVFPLCHDETQEVAIRFGAACTPDIFLFDKDCKLAYRGQLDGSRPGNGVPVDGRDLRAAMDALLNGGRPSAEQRPSTGCNIKWKPGNQPVYYQSALVNKK
ncbi:MAG TPA: thioredoxin family protein [Bryobacteraceae bacterium]|nr:thioredoxin family protein [Bryobacteraceae bacterium]